ncbi:MAG: substrate-binding domain-containing protein [Emcibacteraceae bacterium]|nr:substrate-binding domain-containing protein [Emcibacteraceae bacterium]
MTRIIYIPIVLMVLFLAAKFLLNGQDQPITFMATTTTRDSGLLAVLIPALEKDTGLDIQVVAFGTGKVLRSAMDGNADIIMVHDQISEKKFMDEGYGSERLPIMQNDFVIIGPITDPANIGGSNTAIQAFDRIVQSKTPFVSRGDDSGTHKAELRIWQATMTDPGKISAANYVQTGAGMGRTLNIAIEKSAYSLTDRATWVTFQNKGSSIILFAGDEILKNIYSIISVNPELHEHISRKNQNLILKWFKSDQSRQLILNFKMNGTPLYNPINQS